MQVPSLQARDLLPEGTDWSIPCEGSSEGSAFSSLLSALEGEEASEKSASLDPEGIPLLLGSLVGVVAPVFGGNLPESEVPLSRSESPARILTGWRNTQIPIQFESLRPIEQVDKQETETPPNIPANRLQTLLNQMEWVEDDEAFSIDFYPGDRRERAVQQLGTPKVESLNVSDLPVSPQVRSEPQCQQPLIRDPLTVMQEMPVEGAVRMDKADTIDSGHTPQRAEHPTSSPLPLSSTLQSHLAGEQLARVSEDIAPISDPARLALVEQVAIHVERLALRSQEQSITLQLDPPEWGRIEIRVEVDGNAVHTWLFTEHDFARRLLEQSVQNLREQLAQRGLQLGAFTVGTGSQHASRQSRPMPYEIAPITHETHINTRHATESGHLLGRWSAWA